MMEIQGGKISLRAKRIEDAWMDYLWRSDEELSKLDATQPLRMKFEEFLRLFKDQLKYPTPGSGKFDIYTAEGDYIGNCMYYDLDTLNRQAEVGIVIGDRKYWGRRYGFDALVTLIEHLFSTTHTRTLYLHTLHWNARAQRAFQKCGFIPVGEVRRNGMFFVRMELAKTDWQTMREEKLAARDSAVTTTTE